MSNGTEAANHNTNSQKPPDKDEIYGGGIIFHDDSYIHGIAGSDKVSVDPGPQNPTNPAAYAFRQSFRVHKIEPPAPDEEGDISSLASAVGHFGHTKYCDIFGGISLDWAADNIRLYVTDLTIGQKMVLEAQKNNPYVDTSKVVLIKSPFSRQQFSVQMHDIWSDQISNDLKVNVMSASPDCTHMTVTVTETSNFDAAAIGAQIVARLTENIEASDARKPIIPIEIVPGGPVRPLCDI